MDEFLADEEDEDEAWTFMMEQLAKDDREYGLMQADYVRYLEEDVAELKGALHAQENWHVQNAWHAQNAWNQEKMHLQNVIDYLQKENNRMQCNMNSYYL